MNIAQLSEQLKDVPQNRLVDYAKNPNSVVPQFLALAEIQRRQQLSAQAQPPASTVANDVLMQAQPPIQPQMQPQMAQMAQQLPENQPGVAQLPSRVAPEGFAGGGIVAFADGGLSLDDDEEDDREMARLFPKSSFSDFQSMLASTIPSGIRALADKLPKSYEETKLKQATMQPNTQEPNTKKGGHKYEQAVLDEAKRQGVDPNLALHVLYKETGNLKDPETARSKAGAIGIMQLMPKTAAGLGVNPLDPMDNIRGGVTYLKQMADKYKENRLAAAAYNAGPGNLEKALRRQGGLDTLPNETRNYIAGLAQGGEVKGFAGPEGSLVGPLGEPIEDYLEKNPAKSKAEKLLTEAEKARARDLSQAQETLRRNAARVSEMRGAPAAAAAETTSNIGRLNKLLGGILTPTAVYEGGKYATNRAMDVVSPQAYSATRDILSGAGGGDDTALASAIMNQADYTKEPSSWSTALRNIFGDSSSTAPVAPKTAPVSEPVIPPRQTITTPPVVEYKPDDYAKAGDKKEEKAPLTEAQMYAQELRESIKQQTEEMAKQKKLQLGLSLLGAAASGLQSQSPYFAPGMGAALAGGVGTYGALQKQEAEQAKNLLAGRLGLYKIGAGEAASAADIALRNEMLKRKDEQYEESMGQRKIESSQRNTLMAQAEYRKYEDQLKENFQKLYPIPMPKDPGYQAALKALENDPVRKELYALAFPNLAKQQVTATPTGTRPPLSTFNK